LGVERFGEPNSSSLANSVRGGERPSDLISAITGVISGKRGKLINIEQREVLTIVEGEIPAAETMDLSETMRGATAGRAVWNTYFKLWQQVPPNMLPVLVEQIRKRKGLPAEASKASEFIDNE
jgi:elongation factor 2